MSTAACINSLVAYSSGIPIRLDDAPLLPSPGCVVVGVPHDPSCDKTRTCSYYLVTDSISDWAGPRPLGRHLHIIDKHMSQPSKKLDEVEPWSFTSHQDLRTSVLAWASKVLEINFNVLFLADDGAQRSMTRFRPWVRGVKAPTVDPNTVAVFTDVYRGLGMSWYPGAQCYSYAPAAMSPKQLEDVMRL